MLDALRTLGCVVRSDGGATSITGLGARPGRARSETLPRQRRHRDAPAGRRAGIAVPARRRHASSCAACRACTSGRSATWSTRCVRSAARSTTSAPKAIRRCACTAGAPAALRDRRADRVRGDVSSQFLTALLLALPLRDERRAVATIEVDGELISKPYVEITLNLLARFGIAVQRDGWQRFTVPAGQQLSLAGRHPCRGRRVVGVVLHRRSARSPRPRRRCASKASAATRSRATFAFVDAARAMGAHDRQRPPDGSRCDAVAGRLRAIDARLQPHPRRGDDARP